MRKRRPRTEGKLISGLRWPLIRHRHAAHGAAQGITPGSQLPVHKGTGWALGAEHRDEGLEGGGHQIQSLHPSSVTNPVLSLVCLAAFCPELPPSPTSAARGTWAKPSRDPAARAGSGPCSPLGWVALGHECALLLPPKPHTAIAVLHQGLCTSPVMFCFIYLFIYF